ESRIATETMNIAAYHAMRRKPVLRSGLTRLTNAVPRAAQGMDQLDAELAVHLGAQAADVGLDDAGARVEVKIPDVFEQHRAGDELAGVAHQVLEQLEFL